MKIIIERQQCSEPHHAWWTIKWEVFCGAMTSETFTDPEKAIYRLASIWSLMGETSNIAHPYVELPYADV